MKKTLFTCLALFLATAAPARVQTPAPTSVTDRDGSPSFEKETVVVESFLHSRTVPLPYVEVLRGHILGGFADRGRHIVLDAEALAGGGRLPAPALTTPETAAADLAALLETLAPEAAASGARYLVSGAIADYKFDHIEIPARDPKKPPVQGFKATFRVILSAYDLKFRRPLPDEPFTLTASAPAAQDADLAALATIRKTLEYYIDRNYKFETCILELCPADRKGRVRELWIHSGTDMGVREGDLFLVYEEVPIGGEMTRRKVGRLRVNDAQNPTVARCKIAKGDAEIASAFLAGRALICVSDGKAFGY